MRVLDLFSGIGGFSLGLERAGMSTVAFCEIEEYPRKVLKKHWPDVPIYKDIRELTGDRLKQDGITADLICGGYPCQPFSTAGKRQGEGDDRHLWPEMYRLIKTIRPRWVIAENVAGHVSMGLDAVLSDLEAEDYAWWPFIIPACAVDAKHRRDRIWIIANASSGRGRSNAGAQSRTQKESTELLSQDGEPLPGDSEAICGDVANTRCNSGGTGETMDRNQAQRNKRITHLTDSSEVMAHSISSTSWGGVNCRDGDRQERSSAKTGRKSLQSKNRGSHTSDAQQSSKVVADPDSKRGCSRNPGREDAEAARQSPGYSGNNGKGVEFWPTEPPVGRVANGIPRRVDRLKGLGNAVVPQVVEVIGRAILECEN